MFIVHAATSLWLIQGSSQLSLHITLLVCKDFLMDLWWVYMLMNSNLVLEFSEITDDAETKTCFFLF